MDGYPPPPLMQTKVLEGLIEEDDRVPDAWHLLALAYYSGHQYVEAAEVLAKGQTLLAKLGAGPEDEITQVRGRGGWRWVGQRWRRWKRCGAAGRRGLAMLTGSGCMVLWGKGRPGKTGMVVERTGE